MKALTPRGGPKVSVRRARFGAGSKSVIVTTDKDSEFQRLVRVDIATGTHTPLSKDIDWDIEEFELTRDGKLNAFVSNEAGVGKLHLIDAKSGKELRTPKLRSESSRGWSGTRTGRDLAFNLTSARSPNTYIRST